MHDLTAYLRRIGLEAVHGADPVTLRQVVLHHALSIPFENFDAYTGRRISLDPADVERKLVTQRRGGWCFEQNLLLGNALRAIGFTVTDLAGRVVWGREADAVVPRTHRVLLVESEGRQWLADVGFGGMSLTGVLDLGSSQPQATPHGQFRLRQMGPEQLVEAWVAGRWLPMYRFDLHRQLPVDFEAANFQLVHDPGSHFTQGLRVSRVLADGRLALRDTELAFHPLQGESQREALPDAQAVLDVLRGRFGLDVDAVPQLLPRLERQFASGSAIRS